MSLWSNACRKARLCLWTGGWGSGPPSPAPTAHPPPAPRPILPYFWQVGQAQSESMGRKSFSYCCFFSCRFPVGTKAEPKRWGRGGGGEGRSTRSPSSPAPPPPQPPQPPTPVCPLPRASPLSAWGRRSRTCHIQEPRRPPDQWHSWEEGHGGREQRTSCPGHTPTSPPTHNTPTPQGLGHIPSEPPPEESHVLLSSPPRQGCVFPPTPAQAGVPRNPLPTGRAVSPPLHIPDPHQVAWLVLRQP